MKARFPRKIKKRLKRDTAFAINKAVSIAFKAMKEAQNYYIACSKMPNFAKGTKVNMCANSAGGEFIIKG